MDTDESQSITWEEFKAAFLPKKGDHWFHRDTLGDWSEPVVNIRSRLADLLQGHQLMEVVASLSAFEAEDALIGDTARNEAEMLRQKVCNGWCFSDVSLERLVAAAVAGSTRGS